MNQVLIDTDVLLDVLANREDIVRESKRVLELSEQGEIDGYVTPVTVAHCYYLLRKEHSHTKVIEILRKLLLIVQIAPMDHTVVSKAVESGFSDFEDALQNFSALALSNTFVVITRNTRDYRKSTLTVLSPKDYLNARENVK